ncbi:hypothetical protein KZX37_08050 [Microbacterium sp. EYE_5]|uniref:hypothetical protein n=1 Tax=unclassified Microbacterium TaxID=2609290 RepID=UPI0020053C44|nr:MULTISPECIES: hypothetical protein [unclassified Microbacterium]MCK6081535.1 hypothetical protein [Microbacterium sp. EYE_382]MCK6086805.1 hypothetical protein [Microbacterium sp. EYE_384]MCK6123697.1 hypothetical protein [Microbacterium sp. EYE_80]MCK6126606.1 hypothetical protein [Microbacterium sp. EYE_79]MCK6142489.1 hypothetical protein [Microbacterium sp. EYE_39]
MNVRVQTGLSIVAVVFTAYLAVGGLVWTAPVRQPAVFIAALSLYLATTWLCVFWGATPRAAAPVADGSLRRGEALPMWLCLLVLATAALVPLATWSAVDESARLAPFATWSLGGIGALLTIVAVRRRALIAWIGVFVLGVSAAFWIGVLDALTLGMVGAAVWVVAAQLLTMLVDRAAVDTAELTGIQRRSFEWLASQEGRRRERRVRVQQALAVAGPILIRTIESDGGLEPEEREQARLAEGSLRDELRGPRLLDESVRAMLQGARRRGSTVTVLDEGGLDGAAPDALDRIRADLAEALEGASSERIYIRTSPHPRVAVTVVGRSRRRDDPDGEEVVDLWHEISHPRPGAER